MVINTMYAPPAVQQTAGQSLIYWLDAPGINTQDPNLNYGTYTLNLQSRITEGTATACVNWSVKIVLTAGPVLDTTNSTASLTPGPCQ
jgi:hypothetical protein